MISVAASSQVLEALSWSRPLKRRNPRASNQNPEAQRLKARNPNKRPEALYLQRPEAPQIETPRLELKSRTRQFWTLHCIDSSKVTWKWRGAQYMTTILCIGTSMSFHVNLGESKMTVRALRWIEFWTSMSKSLPLSLWILYFYIGLSYKKP